MLFDSWFFLRGFNEVGNFTMRNGRRNYFTVPTVTKFTKGSSSGAQLPDSGDVHFRIPPPRHCQDHVANMSGCQALERRLFSVFCFAFDLKFDQSLEMIPQWWSPQRWVSSSMVALRKTRFLTICWGVSHFWIKHTVQFMFWMSALMFETCALHVVPDTWWWIVLLVS